MLEKEHVCYTLMILNGLAVKLQVEKNTESIFQVL